jgi:hypothetical protein
LLPSGVAVSLWGGRLRVRDGGHYNPKHWLVHVLDVPYWMYRTGCDRITVLDVRNVLDVVDVLHGVDALHVVHVVDALYALDVLHLYIP